MRHLKKGRKFGKKRGPRKAFLKILAANLVRSGKIATTNARAKELRPIVERLITQAKKKNLSGLRLLLSYLPKQSAYKLYHDIAPRYQERKGGCLRITKLGRGRKHDGARMAVIEFV